MDKLTLRPMTSAEFDEFKSRTDLEYAAEHVAAGNWTAEEAQARAVAETESLLPQGVDTPGVLLLMAEDEDGVAIGHVWVALERKPGSNLGAWIYDIEIKPEHRGKGFGRALLLAAEQESARHGVHSIGLNVFGPNKVARSLYESAGYKVTTMQMHKELAGPSAQ